MNEQKRPTWDEYFLAIAATVASRADCTRRKVGTVIVKENRIMATGYNGGRPGGASCMKGQCPRGRHAETVDVVGGARCVCGKKWPCEDAAKAFDDPAGGSSYDIGAGSCIALHAEQNAVMYAGLDERKGSTIYITDEPCAGCERLLGGSGIIRIWTPQRQRGRLKFMAESNLMLHETNPGANFKEWW